MSSKKIIVFSLCLFIVLSVLLLGEVQVQKYSSEVKVADIRFFRGGFEVPPKSQRYYTTRFPRSTTHVVYCQVEFINPLFNVERHSYRLSWRYFNPDGSLFKELNSEFAVKQSSYIVSYVKGIGWGDPGSWPSGTYAVHVYIGDKKVGEKYFSIYEDSVSKNLGTIKSSKRPFGDAIYNGDAAMVAALLADGEDPNVKDKDGGYPLITAIIRGHADVVKVLLDYGADLRVKDTKGRTALMLARFRQNIDILNLLRKVENLDINGGWVGKWASPAGHMYDFIMNLKTRASNRIDGVIKWTLTYTPIADERLKIGLTATENIQGIYDPYTRLADVDGSKESDPYAIISLSKFKIILSSDGETLHGKVFSETKKTEFLANRKR